MGTSIGAALLAATLLLGVSANGAAAADTNKAQATDASARRHHRHERYLYRPNDPAPMYYGRPVYYAPAPFLPIPPLWGYGWEWW